MNRVRYLKPASPLVVPIVGFRLLVCAVVLSFLVFSSGPSAALASASKKEASGSTGDRPYIRKILRNGLEVILSDDPQEPLVCLMVLIRAGSVSEGRNLGSGLAHLTEHMLFQGAEYGKDSQMARRIEQVGGTINAFTSMDLTALTVSVPAAEFDTALDVAAEPFLSLDPDRESFRNEKAVIRKEFNMRKDAPDIQARELLWATAYRVHPYRLPIIGHRPLFDRLTLEDVRAFLDAQYVPDNMLVVAAGDLPDDAVGRIRSRFGKLKRKPIPLPLAVMEPPQAGLRVAERTAPVALTRILLGFHVPGLGHPDAIALDAAAMVLGKGRSSRLYRKLVQGGVAYAANAWNYTPSGPGLFGISMVVEDARRKEALSAARDCLDELRSRPVSREELEKAVRQVRAGNLFSRQTVEGKAMDIGTNAMITGNPNYSDFMLSRIRKVLPGDVQRVAQAYLKEANLTVAFLRPQNDGEPTPRPVPQEEEQEPTGIFLEDLGGGLILLVERRGSLPIVSLRAVALGGIFDETAKNNGIYRLMSELLVRGTAALSAEQIAETIDSTGGTYGTYSANNSFGVAVDVPKEALPTALKLLGRFLSRASFPRDEVLRARERALALLRSRRENPLEWGVLAVRKRLFGKRSLGLDPVGNEESLRSITRIDLKALYGRAVRRGNLVLCVSGDVVPEMVFKQARRAFQEIPTGPRLALKDGPKTPEREGREPLRIERDQAQTVILAGYRGPSLRSPHRYAMDCIAELFSGQSSAIFRRLRESLGAVYYVGAVPVYGLKEGCMILYAGTDTENAQIVEEALAEEVARIIEGDFEPGELERVRTELIGTRMRQLQKLSARSLSLALNELYGLGYREALLYEERIRGTTASNVSAAAARYLSRDGKVVVRIGPSPGRVGMQNETEPQEKHP